MVRSGPSDFWGMIFLVLRSYSMGAGTYTGIEAVSNGIPVLREPRVQTARLTMRYMAVSLAFIVIGLWSAICSIAWGRSRARRSMRSCSTELRLGWNDRAARALHSRQPSCRRRFSFPWRHKPAFWGAPACWPTCRWTAGFPHAVLRSQRPAGHSERHPDHGRRCRWSSWWSPRGSVRLLVVLYSINVFITFSLSQLGMVRHWWRRSRPDQGLGGQAADQRRGSGAHQLHPGLDDHVQVLRRRLGHAADYRDLDRAGDPGAAALRDRGSATAPAR